MIKDIELVVVEQFEQVVAEHTERNGLMKLVIAHIDMIEQVIESIKLVKRAIKIGSKVAKHNSKGWFMQEGLSCYDEICGRLVQPFNEEEVVF